MKYVVTILVLIAIAVACTYELEGEFHKEIDPKAPPKITVSLNDLEPGSTLTLTEATTFEFKYSIEPGTIKTMATYIDQNLYSTGYGYIVGTQSVTKFTLDAGNASPGLHTLKIIITSTSGTGSLADIAGNEVRTVETSWQINFITGSAPPPVLTLSEVNGYLKVSWTPFTGANFNGYQLVMDNGNVNNSQFRVFNDPSTSSFIDSSYIGGYFKRYTLYVNTKPFNSSQGSIAIDDNVGLQVDLRMSDTTYLFSWNKADYSSVFKSYTLYVGTDDVHTITDINDTTFRYDPDKFVFGQPVFASVSLDCKDHTPAYFSPYTGVQSDQYLPGTKKFSAQQIVYNNTVNHVFGVPLNENALRTFSSELEGLGVTMDARVSVPFTGPVYYKPDDNFGIYALSLTTNGVMDELDLRPFTNDGKIYGINSVTGTSTGVVLVYFNAKDDFNQVRQHQITYDMTNNKVLMPKAIATGGALSGNGKYFRSGNNVYINNGSFFDTGWVLPTANSVFRADNPEEVFCFVSGAIQVRKSLDGTLLRTMPMPAGTVNNNIYDPVKHMFMFVSDSQSTTNKVIDVETLKEYTIYGAEGSQLINGNFVNIREYYYKAIK